MFKNIIEIDNISRKLKPCNWPHLTIAQLSKINLIPILLYIS